MSPPLSQKENRAGGEEKDAGATSPGSWKMEGRDRASARSCGFRKAFFPTEGNTAWLDPVVS